MIDEYKDSIYDKFCKPQFQALFEKNDDLAKNQKATLAEIQALKGKIYIDNGNRSLMTRIKDSEYVVAEYVKEFMKHIKEHEELKRNWSDVFYSLVKNALWLILVAVMTYLITRANSG